MHQKSNCPPKVLASIPKRVEKRLVGLASIMECFNQKKEQYQKALREAGFSHVLRIEEERPEHQSQQEQGSPGERKNQENRRNRGRNVRWFNPPSNMFIQNNYSFLETTLFQSGFDYGLRACLPIILSIYLLLLQVVNLRLQFIDSDLINAASVS